MPIAQIPFTQLNKSADKIAAGQWNQSQYDGYWQEVLTPDGPKVLWCKRPGLTLFCNLGEPARIDGLWYWVRQDLLIAACNGKIFKITSTGTSTDITGTATMTAGNRPTFSDIYGTDIYIASGGRIGKFSTTAGAYLADADAPTTVRFLGVMNKVLVGLNDTSERFDWAEAIDPTDWAGNYANAENQPDLAKSMLVANNYLYFHGQSTTELWRDDGITFVRDPQVIQRGSAARYSVCDINGVIYWLDNTREVTRLEGYSPVIISNPELSRYLKSFSTVDDATGDYLKAEGRHFYVLSFPTEQKTLVYDIGLSQWYEWAYWDTATATYKSWKGSCIADATSWNKVLIGDRSGSNIYYVGGYDDNGDTIRTVLQSDFVDRGGAEVRKFCHSLTLTFKRSDTAATPKKMIINWRDDGQADWSNSIEADIEGSNTTENMVKLTRLGSYKKRQWRFIMSDSTQSCLLSAVENFTYGR